MTSNRLVGSSRTFCSVLEDDFIVKAYLRI
jgi:hypothetical protein